MNVEFRNLEPIDYFILPDEPQRGGSDDEEGPNRFVEASKSERLNRLPDSHLVSNQDASSLLEALEDGVPLVGVEGFKKRWFQVVHRWFQVEMESMYLLVFVKFEFFGERFV